MKKFTFNKQFMVLMFLLLNCFASYAADKYLFFKQITINLTEAGTLPNKIEKSRKFSNLKIIGEINGTDLRFIREMAGGDGYGGILSILDLSEARIVEGGDYYYNNNYNNDYFYTSNDIIGEYTFFHCTSLKSIKLPSSVTKIEDYAFSECGDLTSVNIPSNVTKIGKEAFTSCSLTSVDIPSSVTKIGESAFKACSSLTSVNIPSNVTEIENKTFSNCKSLTSINIPSSVTKIGDGAFCFCIYNHRTTKTNQKYPSVNL